MRNVTIKSSLYLLVGVSAIACFSQAYISGLDLSKIKDFYMNPDTTLRSY